MKNNDLILMRHEFPLEMKNYSEDEEKAFPRDGEHIFVIYNGEFILATFYWKYSSFKYKNNIRIRDGEGSFDIVINEGTEDEEWFERNNDNKDKYPFEFWWKLPSMKEVESMIRTNN